MDEVKRWSDAEIAQGHELDDDDLSIEFAARLADQVWLLREKLKTETLSPTEQAFLALCEKATESSHQSESLPVEKETPSGMQGCQTQAWQCCCTFTSREQHLLQFNLGIV